MGKGHVILQNEKPRGGTVRATYMVKKCERKEDFQGRMVKECEWEKALQLCMER